MKIKLLVVLIRCFSTAAIAMNAVSALANESTNQEVSSELINSVVEAAAAGSGSVNTNIGAQIDSDVTLKMLEDVKSQADIAEQTYQSDTAQMGDDARFKSNEHKDIANQIYKKMQGQVETLNAGPEYAGLMNDQPTTVIFGSQSMSGLRSLLEMASGEDDVLVIVRGIPEGTDIPTGVMGIQKMAGEFNPPAKVLLLPKLFEQHSITQTPVIMRFDGDPTSPNTEPKVIARADGISNPIWLKEQIASGKTGHLGVFGPLEEIKERNIKDVMKERAAQIDWAEKKAHAYNRYWDKAKFTVLGPALVDRVRLLTPTIRVKKDILDHNGAIITPKQTINALEKRPFTQALLVFNPTIKAEVEFIKQKILYYKSQTNITRVVVVATEIDRDRAWDGYKSLNDYLDHHVNLLTSDITKSFNIEYTPTVVTADNDKKEFVISEFAMIGTMKREEDD